MQTHTKTAEVIDVADQHEELAEVDDFTAFVRATATPLLRTATLLCGDQHRAQDLVQSTYAKVFAKWARVQRAEQPVAYTRTVLTRTFLSERRRRSSTELPVETVGDRPSEGHDPSTRLALLDALALLTPSDRVVLVLRHWEDRSVAETADILGISENACRTRTSRALDRLRVHYLIED